MNEMWENKKIIYKNNSIIIFSTFANSTIITAAFIYTPGLFWLLLITKPLLMAGIYNVKQTNRSYLSRMIVRLEKLNLIARTKSKSNGRSFSLYITALWKREFAKLDNMATSDMLEMLKHLTDKDCKTLIESMTKIKSILSIS